MDERFWIARTVYYVWLALRGPVVEQRQPERARAARPTTPRPVSLKPVADAH